MAEPLAQAHLDITTGVRPLGLTGQKQFFAMRHPGDDEERRRAAVVAQIIRGFGVFAHEFDRVSKSPACAVRAIIGGYFT